MTQSKRLSSPKCEKCGKQKRRKGHCDICYNRSEPGKARQRKYNGSLKGRIRLALNYYKRLAWSGDSLIAKYEAAPEVRKRIRERNKLSSKRFRQRWGNLNVNPVHRVRWENIRAGLWKEEEHPLM